ncbi:hypothetical protein, partial [Sinorhizobium fredii]|uniref:hypothetical protein n=1 Tax=Rhizobium fredii TaxID=380 RepID=UPI001AEBB9F8
MDLLQAPDRLLHCSNSTVETGKKVIKRELTRHERNGENGWKRGKEQVLQGPRLCRGAYDR